jgi:hypothetical protein
MNEISAVNSAEVHEIKTHSEYECCPYCAKKIDDIHTVLQEFNVLLDEIKPLIKSLTPEPGKKVNPMTLLSLFTAR